MVIRVSIAASSNEPSQEIVDASRIFIDRLRECMESFILYLGGYWGLMRYVAQHACRSGIHCVFILPENPREDPPRSQCYIPIYTGLSMRQRSEALVLSGDVLVSLGGSVGTIIEILMAYANSIPVYVLTGYGMDSDRVMNSFSPHADSRKLTEIKIYYRDPGGMAMDICKEVLQKTRRSRAMASETTRHG